MDKQILNEKYQQVLKETAQVTKAVNSLVKKLDELVGQKAMLEDLMRSVVAEERNDNTKKKQVKPKRGKNVS